MDWEALATTSHYQTAVAIRDVLQSGDTENAAAGLEELIDALSRSDERALESYLVRLMQHIIKWHIQPERRSYSWMATIRETRKQIRKLQQRHRRFTDQRIRDEFWDDAYDSAINEVCKELDVRSIEAPALDWYAVIEQNYDRDATS
jgi:hypothetical protein